MMVNIDVLHADTVELLATETNERQFMTEGVRRIPLDLKEGRIRGVLFLPPGQGPFPGVLDVCTLGGGLTEIRASLLANKGFVVLALAYYGYQDLPRTLPKHFDLEYLEEAITFLRRQPQIIQLLPSPRCFFDEPVHVHVDGLSPHQKVELRSKLLDDKGVIFRASSLYKADATGQVDLCRSPSLGGSYTGVEPMGLFWAMVPETPHSKLVIRDVLTPILVDIEVFSTEGQGAVLGRVTNERALLGEGVRRTPVRGERIRGTLFTPPGPGPFPGVLDMPGMVKGLSEVRACLLANQGFVVLTVALFGYKDLPKQITHFDLEYFEEAVEFLSARPEFHGPGIGLLSISKSGDLSLSMASHLPGISAAISINGCNSNAWLPLHYKGTVIIPPLLPDKGKITLTPSGLLDCREAMTREGNQGSVIPIERSSSRFLFAASEDDRNWNSCLFAQRAAARLRHHGKENFEVVTYPRAGHFLEVPYMPHCPSGFHSAVGKVVVFGGEAKANHEAQLDLWRRVQEFFRKHLEDSSNTVQKSML